MKKNKKYIYIFLASIAVRILFLVIGWAISGTNQEFFQRTYDFFVQAGDSPHYIYLAHNWYASSGEYANLIVFYPLYPILLKIVGFVLVNDVLTGMFISCVCFGVASIYLYKICEMEFSSKSAFFALLLLWLTPFGMFFASVHTESLYIMLTLIAIYYGRKHKWLIAGIAGGLSALTKTQGVLILVFLVYEWVIECVRNKKFSWKGAWSFLTLAGFVIYLFMNKIIIGDWFSFYKYQAAPPWYQSVNWIGDNITQNISMGIQNSGLAPIMYFAQIVFFFLALALLIWAIFSKIRNSYIIYSLAYVMMIFSSGWLISGCRYLTSLVGIYIICAGIKNEMVRNIILTFAGIGAVLISVLIYKNYAIM